MPYKYWLKYLLVKGSSDADIASLCLLYELPTPTKDYLENLRVELGSIRSQDTSWLRKHQILGIWNETPDVMAAKDLLTHFKARPIIEALLISGLSSEDAAMYLKQLVKIEASPRIINLFSHYFWNSEVMSGMAWILFLKDYAGSHGNHLRHYQQKGADHTLWKLGIQVAPDPKQVIADVLFESHKRYNELKTYPNGQDTALAAKMWSEQAFKAISEGRHVDGELTNTLNELNQVPIRLGKRAISSVNSLSTKMPKGE